MLVAANTPCNPWHAFEYKDNTVKLDLTLTLLNRLSLTVHYAYVLVVRNCGSRGCGFQSVRRMLGPFADDVTIRLV